MNANKLWLWLLVSTMTVAALALSSSGCGDDDDDNQGDDDQDDDADDDTDDDVSDDDTILDEVDHLTMTVTGSPAQADGADIVTVTVTAEDADGNPVPGAQLALFYRVAGFESTELTYDDPGDGAFTATLTSIGALTYFLFAEDAAGHEASAEAVFNPGAPASIELEVPMATISEKGDLSTAATITVRDEYDNPVEVEMTDLDLMSTVGTVGEVTQDAERPYYYVTVTDSTYELGQLTAGLTGTSLKTSRPLLFPPTVLSGADGGLPNPGFPADSFFDVYFTVNVPDGQGPLGSFIAAISFDESHLDFIHETPDPTSGCVIDYVTENPGLLSIGGTCEGGVSGSITPVSLRFGATSPEASGEIQIADLQLRCPLGELFSPYDWMTTWAPSFIWPFKAKESRTIHVHIWTQPGHATADAIQTDIDAANLALWFNGLICSCDYFYQIEAEITELTEAQWAAIAGADGQVTADERRVADDANGGDTYDSDAYNVYYGSIRDQNTTGVTNHTSHAAFVDNADDPADNLTLIHEVGHLVTGDIKDSDNDPDHQGSQNAGNLYNYDDTGSAMTADQCEQFPANPLK
jgi:hypothetical protein